MFERLQKDHPGEYQDSKLRAFQRKVSNWKALYGADKEVMFRQNQIAGRMCLSDFTQLKQVQITIGGKVFHHLLYHFRLAFSGWCSVKVVNGGESYAALAEGLQDALGRLGGSPREHRSDSLSAAFKNLSKDAAADTTQRYEQLCKHYDMEPTRNNRGKGHENGAVESPHGHLKKRIHQALLLRGSNDFTSVYRHVITSLERKPQAFRYSQLRDDLFPNDTYKAVWEFLDLHQDARKACKSMVGILGYPSRCNSESTDVLSSWMVTFSIISSLDSGF